MPIRHGLTPVNWGDANRGSLRGFVWLACLLACWLALAWRKGPIAFAAFDRDCPNVAAQAFFAALSGQCWRDCAERIIRKVDCGIPTV